MIADIASVVAAPILQAINDYLAAARSPACMIDIMSQWPNAPLESVTQLRPLCNPDSCSTTGCPYKV